MFWLWNRIKPLIDCEIQNHIPSHDIPTDTPTEKYKEYNTTNEDDHMSKEWFPMIDYDKCIECRTCADMCKHGVYDRNLLTKKPKVVNTLGCIQGCHGCGKKCPTNAIKYHGDKNLL